MPNNNKNRNREEIDMNNHGDIQPIRTQGHTIINLPNNQGHTGIIKKRSIKGHLDKKYGNINTQTEYGRISRKLDRLTYH